MKIPRTLSERQVKRARWLLLVAACVICFNYISTEFAANAQMDDLSAYSGPFYYEGVEFDQYERKESATGFIEEYTAKEAFCSPNLPITVPGTSLMGDLFMGIVYILILFWFFLGIAIVAEIFMEAIEQITSKSVLENVVDEKGNVLQIEKMFWNPTIANLTLMALGSSAPEIILSTAGVGLDIEGVPSDLGPMAIVGSAAFNLLVISAVSILAVGTEEPPKIILDYGVFVVTAVASIWAYVWFYLVLVILTPGRITLAEAGVTFGFMLVLVVLAYGADRWRARGVNEDDDKEKRKRQAAKAALRLLKGRWGTKPMIQAAQWKSPQELPTDTKGKQMTMTEKDTVQERYKEYLDPALLEEATLDDLLDILTPDNPVERIAYRKKATVANKHEFVRVGKNTKGQFSEEKESSAGAFNAAIGFKHLRYSVPESNEFVTVTIEKKINEDVSFWVRTVDDTATAPGDYEAKNELITMKAHEGSRDIQIAIVDDDQWEPDKDFKVQLREELSSELLEGADTECVVTILDEDRPGNIGFKERVVEVRRRDQYAYIELERIDGSDGLISCQATTFVDPARLPGQAAAVEGKDFVPFVKRDIEFKSNVVSVRIDVEMPDDYS